MGLPEGALRRGSRTEILPPADPGLPEGALRRGSRSETLPADPLSPQTGRSTPATSELGFLSEVGGTGMSL